MANIIGNINPPNGELSSTSGVAAIIGRVLDVAYAVAGIATVALLIIGGLKIIMASGEPDKLKQGQDTLTNALIGIIVILASGLVFQFIGKLLGVESLITWFEFELR
jgi:hypothetical protein